MNARLHLFLMPRDDSPVTILCRQTNWQLVAIGLLSLLTWCLLAGSSLERKLVSGGLRLLGNDAVPVGNGNGGWVLSRANPESKFNPSDYPLLISLDSDPSGIFQSTPPSPIDLAVVFSNLHRLGARHVASGAVMDWSAPDPIGLVALERALARFDRVVATVPLGRGVVAEPMPPAMRRASVPIESLLGSTSSLPRVNRCLFPNAILGGDRAWAGFQFIESFQSTEQLPLIALWEDRAVFSFALLCAMRQLDLEPDDLEIQVGKFVRLGAQGPVLPIDAFGCIQADVSTKNDLSAIPAISCIDAKPGLLGDSANPFPVLRDDRAGIDLAAREFSSRFPSILSRIQAAARMGGPYLIRRPAAALELLALVALIAFFAYVKSIIKLKGCYLWPLMAALVLLTQLAGLAAACWLPGIYSLPAIATVAWVEIRKCRLAHRRA